MHPICFKCVLPVFLVCNNNNNNSCRSFEASARLSSDQVRSRDSSGGVFRFEEQSATSASRSSSGVSRCSSRIIFRFFAGCPSSSLSSSLEDNLSSSAVRLTGVSAPTECPPAAVFKNVRPWRRSACPLSRAPLFSPDSYCFGPPAASAARSWHRCSLSGVRFRFRSSRCSRGRPARSSPLSAVGSLADNPAANNFVDIRVSFALTY